MKVAIVGTAPGWERAPYGDPSWSIWGLNDLYELWPHDSLPKFSAWWELHGDTPLTRARRREGHFERVKALGIPVYYLHGEQPTPDSIKLDVDALAKVGRDYFACTNAYQIALALSLGATEIGLYGTPLQSNREVVVERPCVCYWIGLAEGRGVKVTVEHSQSVGLMRHPYRYALDDESERVATWEETWEVYRSIFDWLPRESERLRPAETVDAH